MPLEWEARNTSDDHGTRERPALIERVLVAYDAEGLEWMVAPHDDGTWNWFRCDSTGNPIAGETDHKTEADARAAADARHAKIFKGRDG